MNRMRGGLYTETLQVRLPHSPAPSITEVARVRARFSYPSLDYVPTVPAMWRAVAAAHHDRELVVATRGDGTSDRITYGEADARSAHLARRLLAAGVGKGTRVALLAPNGPDFAVAAIAVGRIGAVLVPINTLYQASELAWLLHHSDVHTLLTVPAILGKDCVDRVEAAVPALTPLAVSGADGLQIAAFPYLRHVAVLGDGDRAWTSSLDATVDEPMLTAAEDTVRPADDMAVIYTSGSLAEPKGVIHTHGALVRHAHFLATEHGWTSADRVYVPMAFFWIGGLVFGFYGPLQLGVTILTEHRFEAGDVLAFLGREQVTYATGWAHVGPALANHPDFPTTDLSSLRDGYQQILLPPERRTPDPTLRVAQLGMTETCSSHTWWPPGEELPEERRGSVGLTGPGFEHKIVDEDGTPVAVGTVGEICVRGDALMRGMVGRSRAEIFDEDGWYHTRDAGSFDDDGFLYFTGRTDDMIKTAGANVSPVEVESVLVAMPEVREAYVVGVPDAERGAVVTGVVVTARGATIAPDELVTRCRAVLAAYKVPKRWEIVPNTDTLPYTTTNKIDRRALVDRLTDGRAQDSVR
jgi:acyl-CoA synthetase (AMP-forming)/AMP-acid ligase II